MARGQVSQDGDEKVSANGYTYVRVAAGKWRPKSHVIMEEKLGRSLRPGETVGFADGDITNFDPSNLAVRGGTSRSTKSKIARLIVRRQELDAMLEELINELPEDERAEYKQLLASFEDRR